MKTKYLSLLMALTLMTAGCGNTGDVAVNESIPSEVIAEQAAKTEPAETAEPEVIAEAEPEVAEEVTSISEQVMFEQDGIKITATGIEEGSFGDLELAMLIENDNEKNITVQARNVSVNGYMVDTIMSSDVATGKKAYDSLSFMPSSFEKCGIEKISNIELSFHIFDADSWDTLFDTDMITLSTSHSETYTQEYDDSGEIIFDDNNIKIVFKELVYDEFMGYSAFFYIENNSSEKITVQARDTSVNGFMVDSIMSPEISPQKKAVDDMGFLNSDIEENKIESFENIETSFHIILGENWSESIDTEPIIINLK